MVLLNTYFYALRHESKSSLSSNQSPTVAANGRDTVSLKKPLWTEGLFSFFRPPSLKLF